MALGLAKLSGFLSEKAQADCCRIMHLEKMSGGAIQENYALDVIFEGGLLNGSHELVLRTDAPSLVEVSHTRAQEFELLRKAYEAGVMVPEPLWVCLDPSVFERPFYIMRRVKGVAEGHILVKDEAIKTNAEGLLEHLGVQLAKIHSITPGSHSFDFLKIPDPTPAAAGVEFFRECLDRLPEAYPTIEWGLRWLELNAPENMILVLNHRDYRVGNLMLDNGVLTGILDWEFADWSDYHEDIGWFCARCWRFGNFSLEAGGIGSREAFYRGYTEISGRSIDPAQAFYWEVFAHMRWAVIAIQQGERHVSGGEESLHLALTGRVRAELEWELLRMTDPKKINNEVNVERDSPTAKNLLETAISLLRNQVLPNTPVSQKLNLLMISNAMAIAARELNGSIELEEATSSDLRRLYPYKIQNNVTELNSILSSDIRSGKFDDSDAVYSVLLENTRRRLEISNPRHLRYSESR